MTWLPQLPVFLLLGALVPAQMAAQATAPPANPTPAPTPAPDATGPASGSSLVDRLVAVVDEDPIFFSDLRRAVQLGLVQAEGGQPWRAALDRLIDQRLRAHEVDRYGIPPASPEAVARQIESITERLGGPERLEAELAALGASKAELEHLVGQQLRLIGYVDERLAPRVLIDDEAIGAYHQEELRTELERQGQSLPAVEAVREGIYTVLHERAINREIGVWTEELRGKARIRDVLGADPDEPLPPVVLQLGGAEASDR